MRRLYIGNFQVPRHTFFVQEADWFIHPSNLWVIQQARAGVRPGQMPPPPPAN